MNKIYFSFIITILVNVFVFAQKTSFTLTSSTKIQPKQQLNIPKGLVNYKLLTFAQKSMSDLSTSYPDELILDLPFLGGEKSTNRVKLRKHYLYADQFTVNGKAQDNHNITHYRVVQDTENPTAYTGALTVSSEGISGVFSDKNQSNNQVLTALDNTGQYILYNDMELEHLNKAMCHIDTSITEQDVDHTAIVAKSTTQSSMIQVSVFFDVDYDIVREKGEEQARVFIETIVNQVAEIYEREGVIVNLAGLELWDRQVPWERDLAGYRTYRSQQSVDADYVHWVNYSWNGSGGVSYVNTACSSYNVSLSEISRRNYGTEDYSYNVQIVAHELGHGLGSVHTHDCAWNGNNTKIDSCGASGIGSCSDPGYPKNGGTIMSYCYAVNGVGVSFANGLGQQPGDLIRERLSTRSCLSSISDQEQDLCQGQTTKRIMFTNNTSCDLVLFKVTEDQQESRYVTIRSSASFTITTSLGGRWVVRDYSDGFIKDFIVRCNTLIYDITGNCNTTDVEDNNVISSDESCQKNSYKYIYLQNLTDCGLDYYRVDDNGVTTFEVRVNRNSKFKAKAFVSEQWIVKRGDVIIQEFEVNCDDVKYAIEVSCDVKYLDTFPTSIKAYQTDQYIGLHTIEGSVKQKTSELTFWDFFSIEKHPLGGVAIKAVNGKYVTYLKDKKELIADSYTLEDSQQFFLERQDHETSIYKIKTAFDTYLSWSGNTPVISSKKAVTNHQSSDTEDTSQWFYIYNYHESADATSILSDIILHIQDGNLSFENMDQDIDLTIFDINGLEILSTQVDKDKPYLTTTQLALMSKGIYLVSLQMQDQRVLRRVVWH